MSKKMTLDERIELALSGRICLVTCAHVDDTLYKDLIDERKRLREALAFARQFMEANKMDDHDHDALNTLNAILNKGGGDE